MKLWVRAPDGRPYIPTERQKAFFASEAKYASFVGGVGSGKTLTGAVWLALTALTRKPTHPGVFLVGRMTYGELQKTSWDMLKRVMPAECILSLTESPQNMQMTLRNGAIIYGWNLSNWENMASLTLDGWWIDEVTEVREREVYDHLCARLRGPAGPRKGRCTGTPNGFDWVFDEFVRNARPGVTECIIAKTTENPHLPLDYLMDLDRKDPDWKARFIDAQFTQFSGQVLHAWDEATHVVDPIDIPRHWNRYRGVDPGFATDPAACLWAACDEEGRIVLYDEFYEKGKVIREQVAAILDKSAGDRFQFTVIDPQAAQKNMETGKEQIDLYRENGLDPIQKGDGRKTAAIAMLNDLLHPHEERTYPSWHPKAGQSPAPGLYVTRNCYHTREEVRSWRFDKRGNPEDKDDHLVACARFVVMANPQRSQSTDSPEMNAQWQRFFAEQMARETADDLPLIGEAA